MKNVQVARLLAYISGMVNHQLLLQSEYLIAENKILRSHLPGRVPLADSQRATLAEIGKRLGLRDSTDSRCCQTGHHPGLVSKADRPQVRRVQTPDLPGATAGGTRNRRTGGPHGSR